MVICCANQKGGVGKTTTAVNLVVCLTRSGDRVLAVDCDPQATMTRQLGVDPRDVVISLVDVLAGRSAASTALISAVAPGVDVVPAARELSGVEMALVGEFGRERFLADALTPLAERYPMIVLDTPPNLGLLTVNALVLADIVLAPVSCEDDASVQGLVELRGTLAKLRRLRDSDPNLLTILTRWAPARVMSQVIAASLDALGVPAIAKVPSRAVVAQAGAEHAPLTITSPDGCVALAYERLADTLTAARLNEPAVTR